MYQKDITPEELKKVKTYERISWDVYLKLIDLNQVKRFRKLRKPRTIFYDENNDCLCYLNPYHKKMFKCAEFLTNNLNL